MTTGELSFFTAIALYAFGSGFGGQRNPDPGAFATRAAFSIDNDAMSLTSVAAIIEPRPGAPGYSWLRIHFYSFPFTAADIAGAVKGNVQSMETKSRNKASNPKDYNRSNAVIQLGVDKDFKVWQVDMAVPGHTCTIAHLEPDVKRFLQDYRFDGRHLRLKSKGSFVCDMKPAAVPNRRYAWDLDVDVPVFQKAAR